VDNPIQASPGILQVGLLTRVRLGHNEALPLLVSQDLPQVDHLTQVNQDLLQMDPLPQALGHNVDLRLPVGPDLQVVHLIPISPILQASSTINDKKIDRVKPMILLHCSTDNNHQVLWKGNEEMFRVTT
jgi:hypothetical protein